MMKIYKITNKINNLVYIGQTKRSLKRRLNEHSKAYSPCIKLRNAIQKYGVANFTIEAIFESECPIVLNYKEKQLIAFHDSIATGYNIKRGGKGYHTRRAGNKGKPSAFKGRKQSDEAKEKMRLAKIGAAPWNKGKTGVYTDELRAEMSRVRRGKPGPNKGKKMSEEQKAKISATKRGVAHVI